MIIEQDFTTVEYTRSIYTVWDLLGDIGGLFDMMKQIASPLISFLSFILGSGLETHLIQLLFKVQKKHADKTSILSFIKNRKPFRSKLCNYLLHKRNKRHQENASEIMT